MRRLSLYGSIICMHWYFDKYEYSSCCVVIIAYISDDFRKERNANYLVNVIVHNKMYSQLCYGARHVGNL